MPTPAVDQLIALLDSAFAGDDWHSLLGNLRPVTPEAWDWIPPRGRRSIRDIVRHVGGSKIMYENHAFGDASITWEHRLVSGGGAVADVVSAKVWLQNGHNRLRHHLVNLDDAELGRLRPTNWGELKPTRWIVTMMIQHDLYHAGEINHLRALHEGEDQWEHDRAP